MLTEEGVEKVEKRLGVANLYDPENIETLHHVEQALRAHTIYKRDRDYVVKDGQVLIVDEHTGRVLPGRRWSDGLHQAIEAKEGVKIENENQTLATVSFQNYFRMYTKLSGMTGTADTEAAEFGEIYNLHVRVIPTNRPMVRKDQEDVVYKTEMGEKFKTVAERDRQAAREGAARPGRHGVDRQERGGLAEVPQEAPACPTTFSTPSSTSARPTSSRRRVARARSPSPPTWPAAVRTSCSAATPRFSARAEVGSPPQPVIHGGRIDLEAATFDPEAYRASGLSHRIEAWQLPRRAVELASRKSAAAEHEKVVAAGRLFILGTERHESRRIDNQLRGRAGRQGDPGGEPLLPIARRRPDARIFGVRSHHRE